MISVLFDFINRIMFALAQTIQAWLLQLTQQNSKFFQVSLQKFNRSRVSTIFGQLEKVFGVARIFKKSFDRLKLLEYGRHQNDKFQLSLSSLGVSRLSRTKRIWLKWIDKNKLLYTKIEKVFFLSIKKNWAQSNVQVRYFKISSTNIEKVRLSTKEKVLEISRPSKICFNHF